ncbi:MAG TPA: flagellin, partial [Candidatus Acidoferrales bacterium]|nr:flagellin [Candidatus Acidoferrales bacterium]
MPGIGGLSIANNLLSNSVQLNLNKNQSALQTSVTRLSSGLRINTAADDPSGLAIAEKLQSQVNGFDQAVRNVQDANNAATVAEGALQTTTDILQRIRTLSVEAASDITSPSDKQNLQVEVTQLL